MSKNESGAAGRRTGIGLAGLKAGALALSLLSLPALPLSLAAADWPMYRGNQARTGYTAEQAYPPLTPVWEFEVQGDVVASPAVYGGMVYAAARSGNIYALDALTGELRWDYSSDDWMDAPPAVSSAAVYAASRDGHLYAFDRLNGAVLWKTALGAPSISGALVAGGRVYAGCGAPVNKLKAFDQATGALLWEHQANQPVETAPSYGGGGIYFGANDGRIYALDPVTGASRWASPGYYQTVGSFGPNAVVYSSGSVYALPGHDERKLFRLSAADGSQLAASPGFAEYSGAASENEVTAPLLSPYRVFAGAGSNPHRVYSFDPVSLEEVEFSSPSAGNTLASGFLSAPSMADDIMYLGTVDARLLAVKPGGEVFWETALSSSCYTSPAVSNGHVYIGLLGGKVAAYRAALIAAISEPCPYDVVYGTVAVYGWLRNPVLSGYKLEYGAGEGPAAWSLVLSTDAAAGSSGGLLGYWDVSSLPNGLYSLRLTALESAASGTDVTAVSVLRVNHMPQPPAGLHVSDEPADSGNKLRLGWTASPSAWVTAYKVYRAPYGGEAAYLAAVSTPAVSYLDAAAVTGSTFTYTVAAFDGYAEALSTFSVSAFAVNNDPSADALAPSAPAGLAAVPGPAGGSVYLSWTAPGGDGDVGSASGYDIRCATYAAFPWASAQVWRSSRPAAGAYGTAETETVTGLQGGVTYYFSLKAYDLNSNYSAASSAASAWAMPDYFPPRAPSGLSAYDRPGDHGGAVALAWELSPDDGAGAADVYGYKVYRSRVSGGFVSSAPYASVGAGRSGYTDPAAAENIRFYYAVAAFDSTNLSTRTVEASAISADNWRFFNASSGGTVRLADGAEVSIPASGVSQNDNILVTRLEGSGYFGTSARAKADTGGARPTGIVYDVRFESTATRLLQPATLTIPYTPGELGTIPAASLRTYVLDGARWTLLPGSRVLPGVSKVSAEVRALGIFTLMGYVPSGAMLSADSVYTYPNPARGDLLTFKFMPAYDSDVEIDVYNVAGEKVANLSRAACPGGAISEISWVIKNIASGVYVYRVEARTASGSKALTKKLAIIH